MNKETQYDSCPAPMDLSVDQGRKVYQAPEITPLETGEIAGGATNVPETNTGLLS